MGTDRVLLETVVLSTVGEGRGIYPMVHFAYKVVCAFIVQ